MKIVLEDRTPWALLALEGSLDAEAGPGVYLAFQRELAKGRTHFVFNLDGVELVDSAGLGVLVRCYRDARLRGGMVVLQRVPRPIERILEFTRLNTIFPVSDEMPSAGQELRAA
jgi:anti-sigma B factor antagonist